MKSHIRPAVIRGEKKFILDVAHVDGKRQRLQFDTNAEAEQEQAALQAQGFNWMALSRQDKDELLFVLKSARDLRTTPTKILEFYKANAVTTTITLGEAIDLTIKCKRATCRRKRYVDHLEVIMRAFAKGREDVLISEITTAHIEEWIGKQKGMDGASAPEPESIRSLLGRLSTLFGLAVKKKYLSKNPVEPIERPFVESKPPMIFTPEQAGRLLGLCRQTDPGFLPYIVLGMFAGVRPAELEKLKWADVHTDEREIVIESAVSKTRQRRVIEMEPLLQDWLRECERVGGEYIVPLDSWLRYEEKVRDSVRWCRNRLCENAGIKWRKDILRKTAASYLMQKHRNEYSVAKGLGNSPKILKRNYDAVVRKAEGEAFWKLTPAAVARENSAGSRGR